MDCREVFSDNLKRMMEDKDFSQKKLAEVAKVSKSSISEYLNKKTIPKLDAIYALAEALDVSVADLVSFSTADNQIFSNKDYFPMDFDVVSKYLGIYYLYYFESDRKNGFLQGEHIADIRYGVILIESSKNSQKNNPLSVRAKLGMKIDRKNFNLNEELQDDCLKFESIPQKDYRLEYTGELEFSSDNFFISLKSERMEDESIDYAHLIFHKPRSLRNYTYFTSALGTINSLSEGKDSLPCIALIGMSKRNLKDISDEKIASLLKMTIQHINLKNEVPSLEIFYSNMMGQEIYTDREHHKFLIEQLLNSRAKTWLEDSLFKYFKLSDDADHDWYKLVHDSKYSEKNKISKDGMYFE